MKKANKLLFFIIIFFSAVILVGSNYFKQLYGDINLDEIIFYLSNGLEGASLDVIYKGIKDSLLSFFCLLLLLLLPITRIKKFSYYIKIRIKNKKYKFQLLPLSNWNKYIYIIIVFTIACIFSYNSLRISEFLSKGKEYSNFIEEEYIDPRSVNIKFPENKRNLIVIYLESFETTMMDKMNGGGWDYSVVPELENLALSNINFSNTDSLGGAYPVTGATWTIAGLVSINSGIPLKIPVDGNSYTSTDEFLKGAYGLGDILKEEGYNLKFMFGSDANFGGRYQYFKTHGNYEIFDLQYALSKGKMKENETVYWGYEDKKLFEWAKEETISLANEKKPFNLNLLTVNTHFEDGFLEDDAEQIYPTQYENVHAHSSKQILEFLEWLKSQPFYNNTTVVLVGDHKSMQSSQYYESKIESDFERVTFNMFLNTTKKPAKEKNRKFTNFDLFPTILSSIDVELEGNRLGLGVNLFSSEKTLLEEYGTKFFNGELSKNSSFYNKVLLDDDYLMMMKSE